MGGRGHRPIIPNDDEVGLKICAFGADDAVGLMLRKLRFLKAVNKRSFLEILSQRNPICYTSTGIPWQ